MLFRSDVATVNALGKLTNLESLSLDGVESVDGATIGALGKLTNLKYLYLSRVKSKDAIKKALPSITIF